MTENKTTKLPDNKKFNLSFIRSISFIEILHINKNPNKKNKKEMDQKNTEFKLYAELVNPFILSTSKKAILFSILEIQK